MAGTARAFRRPCAAARPPAGLPASARRSCCRLASLIRWSIHLTRTLPTCRVLLVLRTGVGARARGGARRRRVEPRARHARAGGVVMGWTGSARCRLAAISFSGDAVPGLRGAVADGGDGAHDLRRIGPARRDSPGARARVAPLRYVGDRSYALYLWHWPVLSSPSSTRGKAPVGTSCLLVAGAFLLSIVSLRAVENPIRRSRWSGSRTLVAAATAVSVVVATAVTGLAAAGRAEARFEARPHLPPPQRRRRRRPRASVHAISRRRSPRSSPPSPRRVAMRRSRAARSTTLAARGRAAGSPARARLCADRGERRNVEPRLSRRADVEQEVDRARRRLARTDVAAGGSPCGTARRLGRVPAATPGVRAVHVERPVRNEPLPHVGLVGGARYAGCIRPSPSSRATSPSTAAATPGAVSTRRSRWHRRSARRCRRSS